MLCGGVSALLKAGFETLVEAGYQPEIAYFECLHELKLIVDLIYRGGLNYMRYSVSDTAEYGDYTAGPRIVTEQTRETMRQLLREIKDGTFAKNWIKENETGREWFEATRVKEQQQQIEKVGEELRAHDDLPRSGHDQANQQAHQSPGVVDSVVAPPSRRLWRRASRPPRRWPRSRGYPSAIHNHADSSSVLVLHSRYLKTSSQFLVLSS